MPQCSRCGRYIFGAQDACSHCSAAARDPDRRAGDRERADAPLFEDAEGTSPDGPLAPIARFNNAAEAGFFAHELAESDGIAVSVRIEESFDALSGRWGTRYLLCVPEAHGRSAAASLQRLVQQTDCDEEDFAEASEKVSGALDPAVQRKVPDTFSEAQTAVHGLDSGDGVHGFDGLHEVGFPAESTSTAAGSGSGVHWMPIVLTLAAGSAAFWGARQFQEAGRADKGPPPAGGRHVDLWDRLASPPRPWVQQHENGRGVRQLHIDSERGVAVIREDLDGDGVFETEIEVRRQPR